MGDAGRKRRAHTKSRRGCRNCKLRSIKCDETRPKCVKCTSFGVACNYDPNAPDLHMTFNEATMIQSPRRASRPISPPLSAITKAPAFPYPTVLCDETSIFQLDRQSWDRMGRYLQRTIFTTATPKLAGILQRSTLSLACAHPFLMHTIQTLTSIHDRHLSLSPSSPTSLQTTSEVYHLSQGVASFNRKLSAPIPSEDRDAVWATCGLMGVIAFCCVDAATAEEAWPLKPSESSDLDWVGMSEKKATIFNLTDPFRPDSLFNILANDYDHGVTAATTKSNFDGIPSVFLQLYGVDDSSTAENNPYYGTMQALAPLMAIQCDKSSIVRYINFISQIGPDFQKLLRLKDSRALLLLAYWYAKVCHSIWWLERRAVVECQAICIYLERYYAAETTMHELLQFPKLKCGLLVA